MADITTAGDEQTREGKQSARDEKAGIYLSAIIAFLLPTIIVAAFFLSSSSSEDGSTRTDSVSPSTGLERIDVNDTTLAVGGDDTDTEVAGVSVERDADDVAPSADSDGAEASAEATEDSRDGDAPAGDEVQIAGPVSSDAPDEAIEPGPDTDASSTVPDESTAVDETQPSSSDDSTGTTQPSTTTIEAPADEASPSTTPTTAAAPATTSTTSTTTTTTLPDAEPAEFSQRIDVGRIGDTTLAMRFMTSSDSRYTVIVRTDGTLVKSKSGEAVGGRLVNELVTGLTPGTDYTVHVVLAGSPPVVSRTVTFRTSGGEPEPATDTIELLNPRVVDLQSTRFELNYESNICANGSFVIREQGGAVVGRNSGQAAGCTTRHLAIPGYWTAALQPNTTYVITVTVEANGAGQGNGNTASTSVTVTTAG